MVEPETGAAPHVPQKTLLVVALVAVTAIIVGIVLIPGLFDGIDDASIPLGVSAHRVDGVPIFIVREKSASEMTVFLADPQHMPGEPLWWCPLEGVFAGPMHGERFDINGRDIGGPAARDLIELSASRRIGRWRIDASSVAMPIPAWTDPPFDAGHPWDSGPGSFCQDPIHS